MYNSVQVSTNLIQIYPFLQNSTFSHSKWQTVTMIDIFVYFRISPAGGAKPDRNIFYIYARIAELLLEHTCKSIKHMYDLWSKYPSFKIVKLININSKYVYYNVVFTRWHHCPKHAKLNMFCIYTVSRWHHCPRHTKENICFYLN